jgi:hypothetical protein
MTDKYDRLIGLIYEGIMDDSHWAHALAQVVDLVGAVGGGLGMQDMKTHRFRGLADLRIDPDLMPTYRRLAPTNTIWREIGQRRSALTDRMVMPKAAFVRTELYADWFVPQGFHGVMACPILFKESASAVVVAFRDKRRQQRAGCRPQRCRYLAASAPDVAAAGVRPAWRSRNAAASRMGRAKAPPRREAPWCARAKPIVSRGN